jgi:hypothetical protein
MIYALNVFNDEAQTQNIHPLRENSTADCICTLYEPWDLEEWVKEKSDSGLRILHDTPLRGTRD